MKSYGMLALSGRFATFVLSVLATASVWADSRPQAYLSKPDSWFRSEEGNRIVRNVLSWQSPPGSWPKNTDTCTSPFTADPKTLKGTFDNGATTDEVRLLARAYQATGDPACRSACLRAVDHVIAAQYPTGGWPQFYPPGAQYHRHITFNDDTMVRLMTFLREISSQENYAFLGEQRRTQAQTAFDRGIGCILRCQIRVNGRLTAWCAQHDERDYSPRPARTYELVSLSGVESVAIVRLLMSLDRPSPEVVAAVEAAVRWFDAVKIEGIRIERVNGDKQVIRDPTAPLLWARFYEIGTNRPIFCGRDGVKKYSLAEIEPERRNGYAWYSNRPAAIAQEHAGWKARLEQRQSMK